MSDLVDEHNIRDDAKLHTIGTGPESILTRQVTFEGPRAADQRPTRNPLEQLADTRSDDSGQSVELPLRVRGYNDPHRKYRRDMT